MAEPIGSFAGIGSGFNYRDLVDEIIRAESFPISTTQSKITLAKNQLSGYTAYRSLLKNLEQSVAQLRDGTALQGMSTTTSGAVNSAGRTVLTATSAAGAEPGSYSIRVLQTAQAEKLSSTAVADPTVALGMAGTIKVSGSDVNIVATDSLNDVRDKINAVNGGATPSGVSASIISDSTSAFRLVLTSATTGSTGVQIDDPNGTIQQLGLYQLVQGRDAQFTVDGVPMKRSSNTVTDVIANLSISLLEADPNTTATVVVERSTALSQSAMQSFVDSYNKIVDFVQQQQRAGSTVSNNPPLYNNPALRLARSALPSALFATIAGGDENSPTLGAMGISLTKEGLLALDTDKFQKAFSSGLRDMQSVTQAVGDAMGGLLESWIGTGGTLSMSEKALTDQITSHESRIDKLNARLDLRKQTLLKQYLAMDVAVQRLQSQGNAFLSAVTSATQSS